MKIAYASDIHLEIGGQKDFRLKEKVDVLILAGDIGKRQQAIHDAQDIANGYAEHIVQIFGNHDYWGARYDKALRLAREAAAQYPNHHFLENDTVMIDGVAFIGATTWTDFNVSSNRHLDMMRADDVMNDYNKISWKYDTNKYGKISPEVVLRLNQESKRYIFDEIDRHESSVVVSHHGPCELSVVERYRGDPDNVYYVNNWGNEIAYQGPHYWFHGHTHEQFTYEIGQTTVMCNALGYPGHTKDNDIKVIDLF